MTWLTRNAWWDMANRFNNLWRRFMSHRQPITPRHRSITSRRPPIIIRPIEPPATGLSDSSPVIRAHLTPRLYRLHRNPWAWVLAVLLHLLVIACVLFIRFRPQPDMTFQNPPGIDVTFAGTGTAQPTTIPPNTQKGPPQQAQTAPPPPPPPSPPPQPAATQDEVQMPDVKLSDLPAPPPPKPEPPRERPVHSRATRPAQEQKYVFLNGMNYGNISPVAPPAPSVSRGLNVSTPMSDAQAATASDFSIKGNAGAGWGAALRKWVEEHAYYPQAAIEQNQQGTATVEFTVDRAGHVSNLRLLDSSGSPFLDQAWSQLFTDNTLPPFPPDAKSDHIVVRYTVHYQIIP